MAESDIELIMRQPFTMTAPTAISCPFGRQSRTRAATAPLHARFAVYVNERGRDRSAVRCALR